MKTKHLSQSLLHIKSEPCTSYCEAVKGNTTYSLRTLTVIVQQKCVYKIDIWLFYIFGQWISFHQTSKNIL